MTTILGQQAEGLAARYLETEGLMIRARNWRNRWCEIDIVAEAKDGTIHIVEVKYRRLSNFGSGFEYITHDKANRLKRAALVWLEDQKLDRPVQIDVISIAGNLANPQIDYLPNAIID